MKTPTTYKNAILKFDAMVAPVIIAANKLRQARDARPVWMWMLVPGFVREPANMIFAAIEEYESEIGRVKEGR